MLTWSAILGVFKSLLDGIVKLVPMYLAWRAGQQGERADSLDRGLKGLDDARKAVDESRRDASVRELRRDKYRAR